MAFPLRPRERDDILWTIPGWSQLAVQRQNTGAYISPLNIYHTRISSIMTRLRIWMRRASKRRLRTIREMNRMWNATLPADEQWNRVKLGRNNLQRGGPYAAVGGISGLLHFGAADESTNWAEGARAAFIGNQDPRYLGRMIDDVWTKNQRARLQ